MINARAFKSRKTLFTNHLIVIADFTDTLARGTPLSPILSLSLSLSLSLCSPIAQSLPALNVCLLIIDALQSRVDGESKRLRSILECQFRYCALRYVERGIRVRDVSNFLEDSGE